MSALLGLLRMHPEPSAPAVQFWSPPQCPDHTQLVESARKYAAGAAGVDVTAGGYVRRAGDRYVLEFSVTSPSGTTTVELEHTSCEVLVDAAAVKLALALEEARPEARAEPRPPPHDDENPLAAPEPPAQVPPPRRRWLAADAAAGVDWGTLPGYGLAVSAGLSLRRWSTVGARVYGVHLPAREVWRIAAPQEGAAFSSFGVGAAGCYAWRVHTLALPWCAGVEVAALRWRGLGQSREFGGRAVVPSLTAQAGLRWPADGRVGVSARADLLAPLARYQIDLHDTTLQYRTRAVGVRTWLGFGVEL